MYWEYNTTTNNNNSIFISRGQCFWYECQSNTRSSITKTHLIDNWKCLSFTVCTEQMLSPYTEHAASGLPNPTHLEAEVRFVQPQDQQVTSRSPRKVVVFTHSLDVD